MIGYGSSLNGQASSPRGLLPKLNDPSQISFSLLTVGAGNPIETRFGHTILRLQDQSTGADLAFNWGIYDFSTPAFYWRFYLGDARYLLAVDRTANLLRYYRLAERRLVVENRLNLTEQQKRKLYGRLRSNLQPDQRSFVYIHLRDNCATRIRDHLDAVLGGALQELHQKKPTPYTYRELIRDHSRHVWWAYLALDVFGNGLMDLPLTQWQAMFLPNRLQSYLNQTPQVSDRGNLVQSTNLLGPKRLIIDLPDRNKVAQPYLWLAGGLWVFAGMLFCLALTPNNLGRWLYSLGVIAWALFNSVLGSIIVVNGFLTHHMELAANFNALLFFPGDLIIVSLALVGRRSALPESSTSKNGFSDGALSGSRLFKVYFLIRLLIIVGIPAAAGLGMITQDVLLPFVVFGLCTIVVYWPLWVASGGTASGGTASGGTVSGGAALGRMPSEKMSSGSTV